MRGIPARLPRGTAYAGMTIQFENHSFCFAVTIRLNLFDLIKCMSSKNNSKISKVYLVGAGPGDLELITVRGLQLISKADVIFYDNLVNPQILNSASSKAELIYVGKRGEGKSSEQKEIEDQIVSAAKKGKVVVRLKGGDPFIFGRGGEEAERLAEEKIPYEIVPGVSSPIAVPAYAGIPLTHRDFASTVVFVTGHSKNRRQETEDRSQSERESCASTESLDWSALAKMGTLVFLMSVKTIRQNMEQLMKAGRDPQEPCALIRWGTYPKQKTWISTIEKISAIVEKEKIMPPAILVVGKVVKLREKISWFETKPLFGKRIVVTRALPESSTRRESFSFSLSSGESFLRQSGYGGRGVGVRGESLATQLTELGAEVIQIPTIEIHPPRSFKKLDASIRKIERYDWIVFTSVHGIRFFFDRLKVLKKDFRSLAKCKIAVVGSMSAKALEEFGFKADLIPKKFNSDDLGKSFSRLNLKDKRILIPRAIEGKKDWIEILKSKKGKVEIVEAYRSRPPSSPVLCQEREWGRGSIDLITFTSSSTAINFYNRLLVKDKILETPCLCMGPTTQKTVQELGFKRIIVSAQATLEGMVEKIINCF